MPVLAQPSIKPVLLPHTPPVSVVMPALSLRMLRIKFRMELVSMASKRSEGSTLSVLTKQRFSQPDSAPAFSPQTPPVWLRPRTLPEAVQAVRRPVASFLPTTPPTWERALTSPLKPQFVSIPRLRPTTPPTMLSSPSVKTEPLMFRSWMFASLPVSRKKPLGDWAELMFRS